MATIKGIDISNNNGFVNLAAVKQSGMEFVYMKCTEGDFYVDRYFPENWSDAEAAQLVRAPYHFARPSSASAVVDADFFLSTFENTASFQVGDFCVLDMEDEKFSGDAGVWSLAWLKYVEGRIGFKPMIYTGPWYLPRMHLSSYPELGEYGLILAAYGTQVPATPLPWTTLAMWQYSDAGAVPGVSGPCDLDMFFGSREQLLKYGKLGATPAPVPSEFNVTPGILAAMKANGEHPATDEQYIGSPGTAGQFSVTISNTGRFYTYVKSLNQVFVN